jgi:hypothetical protein
MQSVDDETPTPLGRIAGALLAGVVAWLAACGVPWMLFGHRYDLFLISHRHRDALSLMHMPMFIAWSGIVALYGAITGFRYGLNGTMDILNLVWNTGESNDPELREAARQFRVITPASIVISLILLYVFHG